MVLLKKEHEAIKALREGENVPQIVLEPPPVVFDGDGVGAAVVIIPAM
jgi:hypothetical protein